jgi:NAD(P)-dependent dehydrogenase (short-subunit alcohol dehydrogenase family)
MPSLKGKTVLIIGRGSGIARAIALASAKTEAALSPPGVTRRVNAIAPRTIDTGAYDALGDERKAALFQARSATNPARRIGTAEDIAAVALMALTSGFLTGVSIPVDGGEHLV